MHDPFVYVMGLKHGAERPVLPEPPLSEKLKSEWTPPEVLETLKQELKEGSLEQAIMACQGFSADDFLQANGMTSPYPDLLLDALIEAVCLKTKERWLPSAKQLWTFCGYDFTRKKYQLRHEKTPEPFSVLNAFSYPFDMIQEKNFKSQIIAAVVQSKEPFRGDLVTWASSLYPVAVCDFMGQKMAEDKYGIHVLRRVYSAKQMKRLINIMKYEFTSLPADYCSLALQEGLKHNGYPSPGQPLKDSREKQKIAFSYLCNRIYQMLSYYD